MRKFARAAVLMLVCVYLSVVPVLGCVECSADCGLTTSVLYYYLFFCSCPTSAGCTGTDLCETCYYDGYVYCSDYGCNEYYQSTYDVDCGCSGGIG
jgi:hypothetical protein